jgi:hypothetical protein
MITFSQAQMNKLVLLTYFKMPSVYHLRLVSLSQKRAKSMPPLPTKLHFVELIAAAAILIVARRLAANACIT